jgi:hypothetical protein
MDGLPQASSGMDRVQRGQARGLGLSVAGASRAGGAGGMLGERGWPSPGSLLGAARGRQAGRRYRRRPIRPMLLILAIAYVVRVKGHCRLRDHSGSPPLRLSIKTYLGAWVTTPGVAVDRGSEPLGCGVPAGGQESMPHLAVW